MTIRKATQADIKLLHEHDIHISERELSTSISLGRVYVAEEGGVFVGWLRYNLFWDNTPFCTLLYIDPRFQRKGFGRRLMEHWENDMRARGFGMLLTSTQVDEEAQHFYRKLGYKDCGGLVVDIPGYEQPMELFLAKGIGKHSSF